MVVSEQTVCPNVSLESLPFLIQTSRRKFINEWIYVYNNTTNLHIWSNRNSFIIFDQGFKKLILRGAGCQSTQPVEVLNVHAPQLAWPQKDTSALWAVKKKKTVLIERHLGPWYPFFKMFLFIHGVNIAGYSL